MEQSLTTIKEYETKTLAIDREARDIVNVPVVLEGYAMSGKPSTMVFMNIQGMTQARLKKLFPLMDPKDPLFARMFAEVKKIMAQVVREKYENRARRIPFDHIKQADFRFKQWTINNLNRINDEYRQIATTPKEVANDGN